jgi:hypothetical protein
MVLISSRNEFRPSRLDDTSSGGAEAVVLESREELEDPTALRAAGEDGRLVPEVSGSRQGIARYGRFARGERVHANFVVSGNVVLTKERHCSNVSPRIHRPRFFRWSVLDVFDCCDTRFLPPPPIITKYYEPPTPGMCAIHFDTTNMEVFA